MSFLDNDQTAQHVAQIAQQMPELIAAISARSSTHALTMSATSSTSAPTTDSNQIGTWPINVSGGSTAPSPVAVMTQDFPEKAGGVFVSNPTSQTLVVLLYGGGLPANPVIADGLQMIVVRPYSWESIICAPKANAVAVLTYGLVVSMATEAQVTALVHGQLGSGQMQEDITSSNPRYWIDTQLVAGDAISATAPWGGTVDLHVVSKTGIGAVTTVRIAPGFSGQVSGTVAGGAIIVAEDFSGDLIFQSSAGVAVRMGSEGAIHLKIGSSATNSSLKIGSRSAGHLVWASQFSALVAGDDVRFRSGTTSTSWANIGYDVTDNFVASSNYIELGNAASLAIRAPESSLQSSSQASHYNFIQNHIRVRPNSFPTIIYSGTVSSSQYSYAQGIDITADDNSVGSVSFVSSNGWSIYKGSIHWGRGVKQPIKLVASNATTDYFNLIYGASLTSTTLGILNTGRVNFEAEPGAYLEGVVNVYDGSRVKLRAGARFANGAISVGAGADVVADSLSGTTPWISGTNLVTGTWIPGNRPLWMTAASVTKTASFTSPVLNVGDCPQITLHSNVTAAKGSLTYTIYSVGRDGHDYPVYSSTAITATSSLSASFGPGLQHAIAIGPQIKVEGAISGTTPSFTLTYDLEGSGGSNA